MRAADGADRVRDAGPELIEASGRGEVALGGCVLGPDSPAFECVACGATAGELGEDLFGGDKWA